MRTRIKTKLSTKTESKTKTKKKIETKTELKSTSYHRFRRQSHFCFEEDQIKSTKQRMYEMFRLKRACKTG